MSVSASSRASRPTSARFSAACSIGTVSRSVRLSQSKRTMASARRSRRSTAGWAGSTRTECPGRRRRARLPQFPVSRCARTQRRATGTQPLTTGGSRRASTTTSHRWQLISEPDGPVQTLGPRNAPWLALPLRRASHEGGPPQRRAAVVVPADQVPAVAALGPGRQAITDGSPPPATAKKRGDDPPCPPTGQRQRP
jgi:hypothetical protein